jgi:PAS domain S-box-containing protein
MEELRLSSTPAEPSKENESRRDGVAIAGPQAIPAATASAGRDALHAINQRIFETSLDLILVVERRGTIIRVSPSAMAILGYRPNEMVGRSAAEFLYHEDLDRTRDEMRAARRGRETRNFACRYVHNDGRAVTLEWTGVWSEPEQQHFFIGRDVTVLKATEQRLQERSDTLVTINRQLSAILKASPVAIFMIDPDGKVVLWNESAERIFGFTAEEALGRLPPYLDDDHMPEFWGFVAEAAADASATGFRETKRRRKDGALIDVSVRWARVNDEAGQMLGLMCAIADTTERRRLESHLRQAQKMEAVGNLTGGMAHDFNNLLGIIILNLDVLREKLASEPEADDPRPDDPEVDELTREAMAAALRGAELIRRLLAFARRQPLQPQRTDINKLVTEITKLLDRTLGEEVRITLDLDDALWASSVDPAQLQASLANLATNARDAMPNGGQLTIATGNRQLDEDYASQYAEVGPGDYAMIEVSDSGEGMAPEVLGQVFEPFFTTKAPGKGTGLGLSMVYGFIKQSGGHINIYSEAGVGTTVRLYLPRAVVGTAVGESAPRTFARGGGQTVLAVEDNPGMRRIVVRQLTEIGYQVVEAQDAHAALEIMESQPVALLFTDVVLPGGTSGYELARIAASRWPAIKIVLTSGFPENRITGDGNSHDFKLLSKPYRKEDIARIIGNALAQDVAQ